MEWWSQESATGRFLSGVSDGLAEREGFEPPVRFPVLQFSRLAPSTTRPPLRLLQFYYSAPFFKGVPEHLPLNFHPITPGQTRSTWVFKTGAINHSATSPR